MSQAAQEGAIPGVSLDALLGSPETNPIQPTALEKQLATVTPEDAAEDNIEKVTFHFKDLLSAAQVEQLEAAAPRESAKMIADPSTILQLGAPVLERLNSASHKMLEAQADIRLPESDQAVNNILREMDGFKAKYRNVNAEETFSKLKKWFKGTKYSFTTMVRDSKPIADKLDIAANEIQKMELRLRDNQVRGKELHSIILDALDDVVMVLAVIEEIIAVTKKEALIADEALQKGEELAKNSPNGLANVEYKGEQVSINELRETHAQIAQALTQLEMAWSDWRSQFFMGYAQAPSVRNITLVSSTMERRLFVFRTMGIPSAKMTLAALQQAVLAKEAGEKGEALSDGLNTLTQDAFRTMGDTVTEVAMASQAPIVNEETIFAMVESIEAQCKGLVAADKWGREQRAKNLQAIQSGEKQISAAYTDSRKELIRNAIQGTAEGSLDEAPLPDADVLSTLGVK